MKFQYIIGCLILLTTTANAFVATAEVDDYYYTNNGNGTDHNMEDGSGLPLSTKTPSRSPTKSSSLKPMKPLSSLPTRVPTFSLSMVKPTVAATKKPTLKPTFLPPKANPTKTTTINPSSRSTAKTAAVPSIPPTQIPTFSLYSIDNYPIATITRNGVLPTAAPTNIPAEAGGGGAGVKRRPTSSPVPTISPSFTRSATPTRSAAPTRSSAPTRSAVPTKAQSKSPSTRPTSRKPTATSTVSPSLFRTAPADDLHYHSNYTVMVGPVNAYTIFYGDFSSPDATKTMGLINHFTANIGNTSWYNMLTNFYQFRGGVKTYVSPSSLTLKQSIQVLRSDELSENGIANLIIGKFNSGELPVDPNGIYTIIFRGDIAMTNSGYSWLYEWCAYHVGDTSFSSVDENRCQPIPKTAPPNNNIGADNMVAVLGHQIAGTITNSMNFASGQLTQLGAWHFDTATNGVEIGDPCQYNFGSFSGNYNLIVNQKSFFVPSLWLPGRGCSMK